MIAASKTDTILLKDVNDKLDVILEAIAAMQRRVYKLPKLTSAMDGLSDDVIMAMMAVRDTRQGLKAIEKRLQKLETAIMKA